MGFLHQVSAFSSFPHPLFLKPAPPALRSTSGFLSPFHFSSANDYDYWRKKEIHLLSVAVAEGSVCPLPHNPQKLPVFQRLQF
jgi:hypothetical protein